LATKALDIASQQRTVSHIIFQEAVFDLKQHDCCPAYFFLCPQLKIKLKYSHFDRVKVIEAKSQAMQNTLTGYDFQDAYKKNGRSENGLLRG
jgi:hypothetical protein